MKWNDGVHSIKSIASNHSSGVSAGTVWNNPSRTFPGKDKQLVAFVSRRRGRERDVVGQGHNLKAGQP